MSSRQPPIPSSSRRRCPRRSAGAVVDPIRHRSQSCRSCGSSRPASRRRRTRSPIRRRYSSSRRSKAMSTCSRRGPARRPNSSPGCRPPKTWYEQLVRSRNMVIAGPSKVVQRFINSLIIGFGSTFLAVFLGTLAAYAFSRFSRAARGRSAVLHPVDADDAADRGRDPDLYDVSLARPLRHQARHDPALHGRQRVARGLAAEGFHRRDPARVRRSRPGRRLHRLQAFRKVVLPQATTGIAATAIFCLIFAWNEYAFAVLLTSGDAQTMPPFIPFIIGEGGQDWPAVAAGNDAVSAADRDVHRPAAQAICCAASPSGRCANEQAARATASRWPLLVAPRPVGGPAMA